MFAVFKEYLVNKSWIETTAMAFRHTSNQYIELFFDNSNQVELFIKGIRLAEYRVDDLAALEQLVNGFEQQEKLRVDDILSVIRDGIDMLGVSSGMHLKDALVQFGLPADFYGNPSLGYLQYGTLRLGYFEGFIDEAAILFQDDLSFDLQDPLLKDMLPAVTATSYLHEIIQLLNCSELKWHSQYEKDHMDYIVVKVGDTADMSFDLDTGYLTRIAFSIKSTQSPIIP